MRQQNVTVFLSTSDYITLLYTLRRILKSEFEIFKFDLKSVIMIVKDISFNLNHKFESKSHNILRKAKLILLPFVICSWKGISAIKNFQLYWMIITALGMWVSIMFKGRKKIFTVRTCFVILMYVQMKNGKVEGRELKKDAMKLSNFVFANWFLLHIYLKVEDLRMEANKKPISHYLPHNIWKSILTSQTKAWKRNLSEFQLKAFSVVALIIMSLQE